MFEWIKKIACCCRTELYRLLGRGALYPKMPPPTQAVISEDEGFSSGSGSVKGDLELTDEYETDIPDPADTQAEPVEV